MPPLPVATSRQVIRALESAGFIFVRQRGSHRIYVSGKRGVTIPVHGKDLRPGTLKSIITQSGLSVEEFIALL